MTVLLIACGCGGSSSLEGDALAASSGGADCVELMTTETLAGRSFAFDGTVVEVQPPGGFDLDAEADAAPSYPEAKFEVRQWFAGGSGDSVVVKMQREVTVGQRLLVSGESLFGDDPLDDPIAWECGFTVEHSDSNATTWEAAW